MRSAAVLQEVADRVFVGRYQPFDVNVGVVLGADAVLVVDTRAGATQGVQVLEDVRRVAGDLIVRHVVNTHVHFDHTFGNRAFGSAAVHAHERVAATLGHHAAEVKAQFATGGGDGAKDCTAHDVADRLATQVRLPDHSFRAAAALDLGGRLVTLRYAGRGHTDGDAAVHVPDCGVTFFGDLVEQSGPPSFGVDSWPLEWPGTLAAHAAELDRHTVVVPGHGAPVDRAFVLRQQAQIEAVARVVRERHAAGMTPAEAARAPDARLPYPPELLEAAFVRGFAQSGSRMGDLGG